MTRFERALLWVATLVCGVSGSVYGWMKYLALTDDPYALVNHPLQPLFLKLHVLSSPVLVFAIGLIFTNHVLTKWTARQPHGRRSGVVAWLTLLPMIASGYLIQTVTDRGSVRWIVAAHLLTGLVYLAGLVAHQALAVRARRQDGGAVKRRVKAGGTILLAALLCAVPTACASVVRVERRWVVMGTYASAEVHARDEARALETIEAIRRTLAAVDGSMSNWKPSSELSVLNREAGRGTYAVQDPDLFRCISIALDFARLTGGAFDPTVGPLMRLWGFRPREPRIPAALEVAEAARHVGWGKVILDPAARSIRFADAALEIDLGGIAKGYALDLVIPVLERSGSRAALVDLGGELYAWRRPPHAEGFTVGIRDPFDGARLLGALAIVNRAVSTSGNYENSFREGERTVGHLMDPTTGRPSASDVVAATVVAESGADADALSTALFVAGSKRAREILARAPRVEALLVVRADDGTMILASRSLEGKLRVEPELLARIGGRIRYELPPSKATRDRKAGG